MNSPSLLQKGTTLSSSIVWHFLLSSSEEQRSLFERPHWPDLVDMVQKLWGLPRPFKFVPYDLSIGSTETKYIKLNTKTQNIFCCVNENLTTFLYTLTGGTRNQKEKKKFSFLKCIQKSNVIKEIIWVLVFSFMYLVSVHPMDIS